MLKCKYVITNCTNPDKNLATEQFLMKYVTEESYILFLWQNENTIVIGRNQDPYTECLVDKLLTTGGHLARRKSGGGAVYHDLGNLNFSILTLKKDSKNVSYQWLIGKALKQFGIDTEYNGRNDLICQGRKFSGNAVFENEDICCQHGTIMISSNIQRMSSLLTPEKGKLDRNHVSSVKSRVMNLSEISTDITVESVRKEILTACRGSIMKYDQNNNEIESLIDFYKSEEWIYGGVR